MAKTELANPLESKIFALQRYMILIKWGNPFLPFLNIKKHLFIEGVFDI